MGRYKDIRRMHSVARLYLITANISLSAFFFRVLGSGMKRFPQISDGNNMPIALPAASDRSAAYYNIDSNF